MKDRYEISLWEDYPVEAHGQPGDPDYIQSHYEERKICVIGSDTMTASYRAYNPELKSELNGTHTLTFKMYYTIKEDEITVDENTFSADEEGNYTVNGHTSEEQRTPTYSTFNLNKTQNPFLNLLVNERKVKCYWKGEWYDFVIKNCREDSSGRSITYTCTDLFINELSKNGFNITLDAELENNTGTILELAETVLDGSDWSLDSSNSDLIQQTKEEPVYEADTEHGWGLTNQTTGSQYGFIPANAKILIFYQQVQDILTYLEESQQVDKIGEIQLAYAPNYKTDTNSQLVNNADCYGDTVKWVKEQIDNKDYLKIISTSNDPQTGSPIVYTHFLVGEHGHVSDRYRASRFVKKPISKLSSLTGKYCNVLIAQQNGSGRWAGAFEQGDEIYKYQTTEWKDALGVSNIVANSKDFVNVSNWEGTNLVFQLYPLLEQGQSLENYTTNSFLHLVNDNFYNHGIKANSSSIPDTGFSNGETYIFRYKARSNVQEGGKNRPSDDYIQTGIEPTICTYKVENDVKVIDTSGDVYFVRKGEPVYPLEPKIDPQTGETVMVWNHWVEFTMECQKSITKNEITDSSKLIGLFLKVNTNCWLQEVQFFKEVYGDTVIQTLPPQTERVRINPGEMNIQAIGTVKYYYFNHTKSQSLKDAKDIDYLWSSSVDWDYGNLLELQYNENFEKIRSISAKRSNRFNLIQTLAQTFECWAQFIIEHDETGRTIYTEGVPHKYVCFKNTIGQETGIGFVYGIDLKTISRSIQSDKIVTKTIVSQNNNEFGTNGFCTISRSEQNYPRANFILNFDYYINQGLLNGGNLNNDLYDSTGDIRYYYLLHQYNIEYDNITEIISNKRTEMSKQTATQTVYEATINADEEQIQSIKTFLLGLAGYESWDDPGMAQFIYDNYDSNNDVKSNMITLQQVQAEKTAYTTMLNDLITSIAQLDNEIQEKEDFQENYVERIKELDLKFYKKYSRFIQEGTWISEDYMDDTLYYLDAQSVAYTSSRPQISYDISVIRISSIEEFKNKVFHLGDIAYVQDTEFFGYTMVGSIRTPYKEKVLISEVVSHFDEPEKDTFKVQNYKTQFEDLFQRITATTQSLQYTTGEYARAASIIEPNGTINVETLQNSIALNEQLVYSAQNESIVQDSTGITLSDTTNPNKKTKLTSNGIFITTDGGTTWKNAVRGEGIATQYLTTGAINTNNITIMDGNFSTFRWDSNGINAYYKLSGGAGINLSQFVRFDHFGIYGIDNSEQGGAYIPTSETDIWNNAKFGMTWKGFFMRNVEDNYSVEVSSLNDIRVMNSGIELVKIGRLSNDLYGIRIGPESAAVMQSDSSGRLWLRNRLDISSNNSYSIGIGYLSGLKPSTSIHEVFNANSAFIVYEDGSMKATAGEFTGEIHATSGTFGDMTINTASSIEAAVDGAGLRFDGNGLTITGAGLTIKDSNNTPIFYYDYDNESLHVNGTGQFTGAIYATEGSFTGSISSDDITVNGGTIGGFIINSLGIYSSDSEENPSLSLLSSGQIDAKNINLGVGAHIERYIRLGDNTYLWNPEDTSANGNVIEIKDDNDNDVVTLDDSGNLTIGDLELRGQTSEIWGDSFSITPSLATFNNILATGRISTVVFDEGSLQSVGGFMMFKPSYKIESFTNDTVTLSQTFRGHIDDYVYVIKDDGTPLPGLIKVVSIANDEVTLDTTITYSGNLVSLIDIGVEDDLIIGINSTNTASTFLKPRGFTISQFNLSQTDPEDPSTKYIDENINPKVFLGDLDTSGINFADVATKSRGFGLYSENVYLTGSLTTDINSTKFAGVNTLNGATASQITGDTSRIVFWAGATDITTEQVRLAPFQVTENGSVYASQGIFTGAILTDSYIRGADIYAARIHGTGKSETPATDYGLAFYDTTDGIVFFEGETGGLSTPTEVFSIGNNGLKRGSNYFIKVGASGADFEGNNYYTKSATEYIRLNTNYMAGAHLNGESEEVVDTKITFDQTTGINFSFLSNSPIMNITQGLIKMSTSSVQMDNTVNFGDKMEYRKVTDGYDLFVLS